MFNICNCTSNYFCLIASKAVKTNTGKAGCRKMCTIYSLLLTTKLHFPKVADRLKLKINVTPNLTMMVTGHGNIKSHTCTNIKL